MIIDFSIKNFRSVKEEQLFSMYAEKKLKHHAGNITYINEKIGVLKTTAIYGANASGKTNLLLALGVLKKLVVDSGYWKDGDLIDVYEPYLLSNDTKNASTRFEIEFFVKGERYSYKVEFNEKNILFEKLDHFKTVKPSNIFTRDSPEDWRSVKFGDSYKGGKRKFSFFPNNTYISKAGNSPESPSFMREIYNYFRSNIISLSPNESVSVLDLSNHPGTRKVMNSFLCKADFGINSFDYKEQDIPIPKGINFPKHVPKEIQKKLTNELSRKVVFHHISEFGDLVSFERKMESQGTLRIFNLVPFFMMVLRTGSTLIVDEIEASLHPHIAELIIKIFNDPTVNLKNAQLIFTTHNMSLMSQKVLRKDQVYLSMKSLEKGTEYFCLDDFDNSLKDTSPFAKWYDEGRLGGIPDINYRDISDAIKETIEHAEEETE